MLEERELLQMSIDKYGKGIQKTIFIEECSELIKEICKYLRRFDLKENISKEIADVEIMLNTLGIMYNINEKDIKGNCNSFKMAISKLLEISLAISNNYKISSDMLNDVWDCVCWIKETLVIYPDVKLYKKQKLNRLLNRINEVE